MPETRTPPALRRPARPRPALILALLLGVPLAACQGTPPDAQAQTAGPVYVASGKGRIDIEGGVIRLAAQRDGIIARVHAEEGERVQAGQRLAELDHETARRQLALAEAELGEARAALARVEVDWRAAQREVERLRSLADNDNVSAQERDLARDRHDGALAALRVARANAAGGVQGEGEQQKKSDMASHYAKKFEDLYEVFNKRVGGGAGRK